MLQMTDPLTFTVPLSFEAHSLAQQYSKQQSNPQRGKQVYLNTLAVYATDYYLRCIGFETDWKASDSRNPLMLKLLDIADLEVKQIGKIECRFVLPDATFCHIPPDVWQDRVGYVAVQLNQSLNEATLLGFTQTAVTEMPLCELQPLDDLIDYLNRVRQQKKTATLRNWLQGSFEVEWQTLQELLNPRQVELAFSYRSAISIVRGQQIDLGLQLGGQSVALVVILREGSDSEVDIKVQVHPMGSQDYLPRGVKLSVRDEVGEEVTEAESREADNFIQQQFSAELGEAFSIQVAWGEAIITQDFLV